MKSRVFAWIACISVVALLLWLQPLALVVGELTARGASSWTVHTLLLVPIGVTAIVFFRLLAGLETFGLFAPLILSFTFDRLSPLNGILIFIGLLVLVTPLGMLMSRFSLLSTARTGILIIFCSLALLTLVALSPHLDARIDLIDIGMPVVALSGMMDRFVSAQMDQSPHEALKLSANTLIVSFLIATLILGNETLRGQITRLPDLLWLAVPACILMGRYTGLRLNEMWRFRTLRGQ